MGDDSFWESICVPASEIRDNIKYHKNQIKKAIHSLNRNKLKELADLLKIDINKVPPGENISNYIMSSDRFIEVYYIREFAKGRRDILEIFLSKPKLKKILSNAIEEKIFPFFRLIAAYNDNPDNLVHALLFCEFLKKRGQDKFICDPIWNGEMSQKLSNKIKDFEKSMRNKYKRRFTHIKSFDDGDSEYYIFHREKSKVVQESFELKNVSYTKKSDLFLFIDKNNNSIEIKSADSRLRKNLAEFLSKNLKINLLYPVNIIEKLDVSKSLKDALINIPENIKQGEIFIDKAKIKKVETSVNVSLIVGEKYKGDIRKTIDELQSNGIIDLTDISNISFFSVNVNGKSYSIMIKKEDSSIILSYDGPFEKGLRDIVLDRFNLPLNVPIPQGDYEIDENSLFNSLLFCQRIDKLTKKSETFLKKMIEDQIINPQENIIWICEDKFTHTFNQHSDSCPKCGAPLKVYRRYQGTGINKEGILNFVKHKLESIYGKDNIKKTERTYRKQIYSLFYIENETYPSYVYLDYGDKNIDPLISHFERSLLPVTIISVRRNNKSLINMNLPMILLSDFYIKNEDHTRNIINKLKENYRSRVEKAASISSKNLNRLIQKEEMEYFSEDLEDDTFNLMKFIFDLGEKWGKDKKRKTLPEAALGYTTYNKNKNGTFSKLPISLIWDSKFRSKDGEYDFDSAEKDKARRYIVQANQSNAVKKFSENLSAYITFCNSVNLTQYKSFTEWQYNYKNWKGSVVLFDLDALVQLYNFAVTEIDLFQSKKQLILSKFSSLISRKDNLYIHITKDIMLKLIKEAKEDLSVVPLDTKELREHLELNEIK